MLKEIMKIIWFYHRNQGRNAVRLDVKHNSKSKIQYYKTP